MTDLDQFHDLIRQMDDHVATLTQKKKEGTNRASLTIRTSIGSSSGKLEGEKKNQIL